MFRRVSLTFALITVLTFVGAPTEPARAASDVVEPAVSELTRIGNLAPGTFGDRFSYIWKFEDSDFYVVHVGVVNPTEQDAEALASIAGGSPRVRLAEAKWSRADLNRWDREAYTLLVQHGVRPVGSIQQRGKEGRTIMLYTEIPAQLRDEIYTRVPREAVKLEVATELPTLLWKRPAGVSI